MEDWFPEHKYKHIYTSLLQVNPPVDDHLLKSALIRRAMTVVDRVLQLREQKPPLNQLMKSGSIGEEVWNQFCKAEAEIEQEVMEVIEEANTFNEGWGKSIYQTASEMVQHDKIRKAQVEVERLRLAEKEVNKVKAKSDN